MKKLLKKEVIIAFIVGIILASSIAVYAYSYAAKDVSYTKPGKNTPIDVETALNELYTIPKGITSNATIGEITRETLGTTGTTITNVNNYKYYYIITTWYKSSSFNYSNGLNNISISATNSELLSLGDVYYNSNTGKGCVSRGYIIFPNGSGENIVLTTNADGMTLYGIN